MLLLTMTLGVQIQFYIKAKRWQSSTINVGIFTAQPVARRINVSVQLWECCCVWKLALRHSAVHMHTMI